jgi:hypothetical protein
MKGYFCEFGSAAQIQKLEPVVAQVQLHETDVEFA